MVELTGDEVLCDVAEPVRIVARESIGRVAQAHQALMHVHAAPGLAVERLWHERRDHAGLLRDGLERVAKRDQIVRGLERRRSVDIDLVLAARDLMM